MQTDCSPAPAAKRTRPPSRAAAWRPDARTLALIAGDALAFLLFAALGRKTHDEAVGLAALGETLWTALPFALAWFAVAPFLGAFRRALTEHPRQMAARTELAWLAAWPVALAARWALSADHQVPWTFALVILLVNAALLGSWRTRFAIATTVFGKRPAGD
jgi:hypothetical protein